MNSFFGGTQGASFIIKKKFDCITVPRNTEFKGGYFACDDNQNIYVYELEGQYIPILRNTINKRYYDHWYYHQQNGEQIGGVNIGTDPGTSNQHTEIRGLKTVTIADEDRDSLDKKKQQTFRPKRGLDGEIESTDYFGTSNFFTAYLEGMVECFKEGGKTNEEVGFGEYVLIDTSDDPNGIDDPDSGKIFRRGLDFQIRDDNPLAGAEYVGKIVGAPGECTETFLDSLDAFVENPGAINKEYKLRQNIVLEEKNYEEYPTSGQVVPNVIYHRSLDDAWFRGEDRIDDIGDTSRGLFYRRETTAEAENLATPGHLNALIYVNENSKLYQPVFSPEGIEGYPYNDLLPGKWNDGGQSYFNDAIQYGWVTLKDESGRITGSRIGFKFPYPVFEWSANSVDPYYHRDDLDETGDTKYNENFNNKDLITRVDNGEHIFYQNFKINIPKGIHGKNILKLENKSEKYVTLNQYKLRREILNVGYGPYSEMLEDTTHTYFFTTDERDWYKKDLNTGYWVIWEERKSFNDIDPFELTHSNLGEIYTQDEFPYFVYTVVELDPITPPVFYPTEDMENEKATNLPYTPFTAASGVKYKIVDLNNELDYIQIDIESVPYWCHYDENVIDDCYNQSRLTIEYQHFERKPQGEKYWIDFGPVVELKDLNLSKTGELTIRFANKKDVQQQLQWVKQIKMVNQSDIVIYYCDGTIASNIEDAIQKIEYIYLQQKTNALKSYVDQEIISEDKVIPTSILDNSTRLFNVIYILTNDQEGYNIGAYKWDGQIWQPTDLALVYVYLIDEDKIISWYQKTVSNTGEITNTPVTVININTMPVITESSVIGTLYGTLSNKDNQRILLKKVIASSNPGEEGSGDQKLHISFNDGLGDRIISGSINYIMETVVTKINKDVVGEVCEPNHLLVLYSDPAVREATKDPNIYYTSQKFGRIRNDWCDLGTVKSEASSVKIVGHIQDPSMLEDGVPPEVLLGSDEFTGCAVVCNNRVYAYDYLSNYWYFVWDFTNTVDSIRTVYVDGNYGSDDSDGSYKYPYKTVKRALTNQFCVQLEVYLKGAEDYSNVYDYNDLLWTRYSNPRPSTWEHKEGYNYAVTFDKKTLTLVKETLGERFIYRDGNYYNTTEENMLIPSIEILIEPAQLKDIANLNPNRLTDEDARYFYIEPNTETPEYIWYIKIEGTDTDIWYEYSDNAWRIINVNVMNTLPIPSASTLQKYYFVKNKLYYGITKDEVEAAEDPYYILDNFITDSFCYKQIKFFNHTNIQNNSLKISNSTFRDVDIVFAESTSGGCVNLELRNCLFERCHLGSPNREIKIGGLQKEASNNDATRLVDTTFYVNALLPNTYINPTTGDITAYKGNYYLTRSRISAKNLMLNGNALTYILSDCSELSTEERVILPVSWINHDATSAFFSSVSKRMIMLITQKDWNTMAEKDPDVAYIITQIEENP